MTPGACSLADGMALAGTTLAALVVAVFVSTYLRR